MLLTMKKISFALMNIFVLLVSLIKVTTQLRCRGNVFDIFGAQIITDQNNEQEAHTSQRDRATLYVSMFYMV